jgi:hypothetical protein
MSKMFAQPTMLDDRKIILSEICPPLGGESNGYELRGNATAVAAYPVAGITDMSYG